MIDPRIINQSVRWLKEADSVLFTAGAGMGVDSGLPDFRGDHGFWNDNPSLKNKNIHYSDISNPECFDSMPELAWGFYGHRLNLYRATEPHIGFKQLLDIGNLMPQGYFVYTSNVDGHFQKAGFDPDRIVECHGSIHYLQCTCLECVDVGIWSAKDVHPQFHEDDSTLAVNLPRCPNCGEVSRPNILMFSDFFGWCYRRSKPAVICRRISA